MTRLTRFGAVACLSALSGLVGPSAFGQAGAVPPPPAPPPIPGDLDQLGRQMSFELRSLGEAVAVDLGDSPRGRRLNDESRELAQAVNEFQSGLRNQGQLFEARRAYSGVDGSWHRLLDEIGRPGSSSPAIDRAAQKVAQTDVRIHGLLTLNDYPPGYHGGNQPLSGMSEMKRLTLALVDRAEALASVIRADMSGPGNVRVVVDAVNLAQAADTYNDALDLNGRVDGTMQNGFAGAAGLCDRLEADLTTANPTPRVVRALEAYKSVEVLVRRSLGLPTTPEDTAGTFLMETPGGGNPVTALSEQLVEQITAFLQVFGPTAGVVPEGGAFLADAQSLQAAATDFRRDAARNLNAGQLAYEFRDVEAIWQRLARRTNRIARGRTGPNIQQVGRIGQTVSEIHRLLGVPGYPPSINNLP